MPAAVPEDPVRIEGVHDPASVHLLERRLLVVHHAIRAVAGLEGDDEADHGRRLPRCIPRCPRVVHHVEVLDGQLPAGHPLLARKGTTLVGPRDLPSIREVSAQYEVVHEPIDEVRDPARLGLAQVRRRERGRRGNERAEQDNGDEGEAAHPLNRRRLGRRVGSLTLVARSSWQRRVHCHPFKRNGTFRRDGSTQLGRAPDGVPILALEARLPSAVSERRTRQPAPADSPGGLDRSQSDERGLHLRLTGEVKR